MDVSDESCQTVAGVCVETQTMDFRLTHEQMSVCKGMLRHIKKAENVIYKLQDVDVEVSSLDNSMVSSSVVNEVSFADLIDIRPLE